MCLLVLVVDSFQLCDIILLPWTPVFVVSNCVSFYWDFGIFSFIICVFLSVSILPMKFGYYFSWTFMANLCTVSINSYSLWVFRFFLPECRFRNGLTLFYLHELPFSQNISCKKSSALKFMYNCHQRWHDGMCFHVLYYFCSAKMHAEGCGHTIWDFVDEHYINYKYDIFMSC